MLQAAYGGYMIQGGTTQYVNSPTYYEPGYNLMTPLEIQGNKSDRFWILLRKREGASENTFVPLTESVLEATVTDASTGDTVTYRLKSNNVNPLWDDNPSDVAPFVLEITNALDLSGPLSTRVRVVDVCVKDITDDDFITFRVISSDSNRYFNYLYVKTNNLSARNTFTALGRDVIVRISSDSDHYVLFSPYAYLKETTKGKADFSYPLDTVYYQRENTYNNEDYTFSISAVSNSFVSEVISVMNVPSYGKAALILIDQIMYKKLVELGSDAYVDIAIEGQLSGITDTFRVNFRRR